MSYWREEYERAEQVIEVLRNLVNKLDECNEAMSGYWAFLKVHNNEYQGPTYEKELDAARTLVLRGREPNE